MQAKQKIARATSQVTSRPVSNGNRADATPAASVEKQPENVQATAVAQGPTPMEKVQCTDSQPVAINQNSDMVTYVTGPKAQGEKKPPDGGNSKPVAAGEDPGNPEPSPAVKRFDFHQDEEELTKSEPSASAEATDMASNKHVSAGDVASDQDPPRNNLLTLFKEWFTDGDKANDADSNTGVPGMASISGVFKDPDLAEKVESVTLVGIIGAPVAWTFHSVFRDYLKYKTTCDEIGQESAYAREVCINRPKRIKDWWKNYKADCEKNGFFRKHKDDSK